MSDKRDMPNSAQILHTLRRFDPRLRVDGNVRALREDIMQEIDIALFLAKHDAISAFKIANRNIDKLLSEMCWSQRRFASEVSFCKDLAREEEMFTDEEKAALDEVLSYYEEHTARETAERFNLNYNNALQKILHACFSKQSGRGGKRQGAGRKKKNT